MNMHRLDASSAIALPSLLSLLTFVACGDDGATQPSKDAAIVDARVTDHEAGTVDSSVEPALDASTDDAASPHDADITATDAGDAPVLATDAAVFTHSECAACTRTPNAASCSAPDTTQWECLGALPTPLLQALSQSCTDRGTNLPRYCCAPTFAPECTP